MLEGNIVYGIKVMFTGILIWQSFLAFIQFSQKCFCLWSNAFIESLLHFSSSFQDVQRVFIAFLFQFSEYPEGLYCISLSVFRIFRGDLLQIRLVFGFWTVLEFSRKWCSISEEISLCRRCRLKQMDKINKCLVLAICTKIGWTNQTMYTDWRRWRKRKIAVSFYV